jgi:hypothetical protein
MKRSVVSIGIWFIACGCKDEDGHPSAVAASTSQPTVTSSKAPIDANVAELPVDAYVANVAEIKPTARQAPQRAKVTEALRTILKSTTANAQLSVTGDAIAIDTPDGECNGRMLIQLRDQLRRIKVDPGIGFDKMNCGEIGDEIDLHTMDGCPPNLSDQLILTNAGVRRDKFAEGISDVMRMPILATGCDAKVMSILFYSGQTDNCNAETLRTFLRESRGPLVKFGFTRVSCGLDGPAIPVR